MKDLAFLEIMHIACFLYKAAVGSFHKKKNFYIFFYIFVQTITMS